MKKLKVALVHDYLKEYGGAERVLEALMRIYPDADIYTTVYMPRFLGPHKTRFKGRKIHTSLLQYLPFKSILISPFRVLSPFVFWLWNFDEYDVVIVSATGAYIPNMIRKGQAKHICYYHTPPRYLYGYETARRVKKHSPVWFVMHIMFHILRLFDFDSSKRPDIVIANSREVAKRIKKFYRRDAQIINPPVEKPPKLYHKDATYYVAGGRLSRAKHPEIAIKLAIKKGFPLKVFGKSFAGFGESIERLAKGHSHIELLGEVSEKKKWELLAHAKAFINPARDEDFGILNVESQMVGTPVIAHASGGALETIIDGETGVFAKNLTVNSFEKAFEKLSTKEWQEEKIRKHAQNYSRKRFEREIQEVIKSVLQ